jgi:hypothetical protein
MLVALCGCATAPENYSPPIQRRTYAAEELSPVGTFVDMADPNAEAYFIQDINSYLEGGSWRWTREKPELRFWLKSNRNLKFKCDFGIADATFAATGPVTLSVYINGHLLSETKCPKAARYSMVKEVPAAWVKPGALNSVALRVDKIFTAKSDGVKLGFVLYKAGFEAE